MRVDQPGKGKPPARRDHPRAGPGERADIAILTEREDAPVSDGERLCLGPGGVHGEDARADQDRVGHGAVSMSAQSRETSISAAAATSRVQT